MQRPPSNARWTLVVALCVAGTVIAEPLPSWNDGAPKQTLVEFVARVTRESSPDYAKPAERIAVFDNDGTLWAEQPLYFQFVFALDRIRTLAPAHPEWKTTQPFKAAIEGDAGALAKSGERGLQEILAASHAGMTTDEFATIVGAWLTTAKHPQLKRPYTQLAYQPMLEVLSYLRANGFKTFIVSGGGVEFMRTFAEQVYGVPPEQVVGSSGETKFGIGADGKPVLVKQAKVEFVDDGPGKPRGIHRFIGRRPILAFGNSDGDYEMLLWTQAGPGARFVALIHHTDAEREYAYDKQSHIGRLDKALTEAEARRWIVIDMKKDWRSIFAAAP
jgi:phosphoglycolate phosphatase-like HAD superfamily hydrolase